MKINLPTHKENWDFVSSPPLFYFLRVLRFRLWCYLTSLPAHFSFLQRKQNFWNKENGALDAVLHSPNAHQLHNALWLEDPMHYFRHQSKPRWNKIEIRNSTHTSIFAFVGHLISICSFMSNKIIVIINIIIFITVTLWCFPTSLPL